MIDTHVATVRVGSIVRLRGVLEAPSPIADLFGDDDPERELTICDEAGTDRLHPTSTLGKAILGHHAGDIVAVPLAQIPIRVEILSVREPCRVVQLGDRVHVDDGDGVMAWRIVEAHEADFLRRAMSAASPVARALLGHPVGADVLVELPGGRATMRIVALD